MGLVRMNQGSISVFYHVGFIIKYGYTKSLWGQETIMIEFRLRMVVRRVARPFARVIDYLSQYHIGLGIDLTVENSPDRPDRSLVQAARTENIGADIIWRI